MCGIVGYVGSRPADHFLIQGLNKLEYRGYDSAGICQLNHEFYVCKTKGRVSDLERALKHTPLKGCIGIAHTRWATHGIPSDENAHPHFDCHQHIAVVHNGIIENYRQLRSMLINEGHIFQSDTDTEVISHLVETYYQGDLLEAVCRAIQELKGSYALAILAKDQPNQLIAVKQDNPLIVGLGQGENYLASDIPAIIDHTAEMLILNDGEVVRLSKEKVELFDRSGEQITKKPVSIQWDPVQVQKGGFEDFMLKEIHEQPQAIQDTIAGRINERGELDLDREIPPHLFEGVSKVQFVACGTAYHAALYGKHLFETLMDIPVEAELASEYRYKRNLADDKTLLIAVSQSGETADTLGAMRLAKAKGARTLAITNVLGSTISREVDAVLYSHAGPEIAVASTKAYTTQLACLCLLIAHFCRLKTGENLAALLLALRGLPDKMSQTIKENAAALKAYGEKIRSASDTFFIGRGIDYASAMEGQLKLKEISYIHGEALAGGELKHGTLALIVEDVPVVALLTQPELADKMVNNLKEVKARGGYVLLLTTDQESDFSDVGDQVLRLPEIHPLLAPLLTVVPTQLLAYYTAKARGCDVDKPRNLAKSITVE